MNRQALFLLLTLAAAPVPLHAAGGALVKPVSGASLSPARPIIAANLKWRKALNAWGLDFRDQAGALGAVLAAGGHPNLEKFASLGSGAQAAEPYAPIVGALAALGYTPRSFRKSGLKERTEAVGKAILEAEARFNGEARALMDAAAAPLAGKAEWEAAVRGLQALGRRGRIYFRETFSEEMESALARARQKLDLARTLEAVAAIEALERSLSHGASAARASEAVSAPRAGRDPAEELASGIGKQLSALSPQSTGAKAIVLGRLAQLSRSILGNAAEAARQRRPLAYILNAMEFELERAKEPRYREILKREIAVIRHGNVYFTPGMAEIRNLLESLSEPGLPAKSPGEGDRASVEERLNRVEALALSGGKAERDLTAELLLLESERMGQEEKTPAYFATQTLLYQTMRRVAEGKKDEPVPARTAVPANKAASRLERIREFFGWNPAAYAFLGMNVLMGIGGSLLALVDASRIAPWLGWTLGGLAVIGFFALGQYLRVGKRWRDHYDEVRSEADKIASHTDVE